MGAFIFGMILIAGCDNGSGPNEQNPELNSNLSSITLSCNEQTGRTIIQILELDTDQDERLFWTATCNSEWLVIEPDFGATPSEVTISAEILDILPNTFLDTLVITLNDYDDVSITIPIVFNYNPVIWPLAVGNTWYATEDGSFKTSWRITKDTIIYGEHYFVLNDGSYAFAYAKNKMDGLWFYGDDLITHFFLGYKYPVSQNEEYNIDYDYGSYSYSELVQTSFQNIDVPCGNFNTIVYRTEMGAEDEYSEIYLSPNVGIIKYIFSDGSWGSTTWVLDSLDLSDE